MAAEREKDFNRFLYFMERQPRRHDAQLLSDIARACFPEKLNLTVLRDLMEAALTWERLGEFKFGGAVYLQREFNFGGQYRWVTTIKQHDSDYESDVAPRGTYNFINVKLPNDGYIYKPELETGDERLDISNADAAEFSSWFMQNLRLTKLFAKEPIIYAQYSAERMEFSIYCVDQENKRILTVEFHHGVPVGKQRNGTFKDWAEDIQWKSEPGEEW